MTSNDLRTYCLTKKEAKESFPFHDNIVVYKVLNKMFCAFDTSTFDRVNFKSEYQASKVLRKLYHAVEPSIHMNKENWNSVFINRDVPDHEILKWIDWSYEICLQENSIKKYSSLVNK